MFHICGQEWYCYIGFGVWCSENDKNLYLVLSVKFQFQNLKGTCFFGVVSWYRMTVYQKINIIFNIAGCYPEALRIIDVYITAQLLWIGNLKWPRHFILKFQNSKIRWWVCDVHIWFDNWYKLHIELITRIIKKKSKIPEAFGINCR